VYSYTGLGFERRSDDFEVKLEVMK
jgi:hypothetical protein